MVIMRIWNECERLKAGVHCCLVWRYEPPLRFGAGLGANVVREGRLLEISRLRLLCNHLATSDENHEKQLV